MGFGAGELSGNIIDPWAYQFPVADETILFLFKLMEMKRQV
jgi:hypothetical protein